MRVVVIVACRRLGPSSDIKPRDDATLIYTADAARMIAALRSGYSLVDDSVSALLL